VFAYVFSGVSIFSSSSWPCFLFVFFFWGGFLGESLGSGGGVGRVEGNRGRPLKGNSKLLQPLFRGGRSLPGRAKKSRRMKSGAGGNILSQESPGRGMDISKRNFWSKDEEKSHPGQRGWEPRPQGRQIFGHSQTRATKEECRVKRFEKL